MGRCVRCKIWRRSMCRCMLLLLLSFTRFLQCCYCLFFVFCPFCSDLMQNQQHSHRWHRIWKQPFGDWFGEQLKRLLHDLCEYNVINLPVCFGSMSSGLSGSDDVFTALNMNADLFWIRQWMGGGFDFRKPKRVFVFHFCCTNWVQTPDRFIRMKETPLRVFVGWNWLGMGFYHYFCLCHSFLLSGGARCNKATKEVWPRSEPTAETTVILTVHTMYWLYFMKFT